MQVAQLDLSLRIPICAWCEPRLPGGEIGELSHGICPRHFRKVVLQSQGLLPKRRRRSIRDESNREALLPL
jgi:hypothetical protein